MSASASEKLAKNNHVKTSQNEITISGKKCNAVKSEVSHTPFFKPTQLGIIRSARALRLRARQENHRKGKRVGKNEHVLGWVIYAYKYTNGPTTTLP